MKDILLSAFHGLNRVVELRCKERVKDLGYADEYALLDVDLQTAQNAQKHLMKRSRFVFALLLLSTEPF